MLGDDVVHRIVVIDCPYRLWRAIRNRAILHLCKDTINGRWLGRILGALKRYLSLDQPSGHL